MFQVSSINSHFLHDFRAFGYQRTKSDEHYAQLELKKSISVQFSFIEELPLLSSSHSLPSP